MDQVYAQCNFMRSAMSLLLLKESCWTMPPKILFISNGHGEDNHSSHVIRTLQQLRPDLQIAALPIVGQGSAYRKLNIPIIGPTLTLPSGGFTYSNQIKLIKDIQAGLFGLLWGQFRAMRRYVPDCDLVFATGDTIGQSFAYFSGRPFISFISCLSALYEGTLPLGRYLFLKPVLQSPRCLTIFTRDSHTAVDLRRQGLTKAQFGGIPSLDRLRPTGKDLQLTAGMPMIALLPGSRMPEAARNLQLQLRWALEIARLAPPVQFRAALVPELMAQLGEIAAAEGWQYQAGVLRYVPVAAAPPLVEVRCYDDAFSDIVCRTTLVLGMAGLAVDQAVAIGKPVIQVAGEGPQFTYAFAEAQTRLLGRSAQIIGTGPATPEILREAAQRTVATIQDADYLQACVENGHQRFGPLGASERIARAVLAYLDTGNVQSVGPVATTANGNIAQAGG